MTEMSDVTVLHQSTPVARKPHFCEMCGRVIAKGETYTRQDNVYDGNRYTWKMCAHCLAAVARAREVDRFGVPDEGVNFEWVEETLADYGCLDDLRMRVNLRRKWARRDGSLVPVPRSTDPDS